MRLAAVVLSIAPLFADSVTINVMHDNLGGRISFKADKTYYYADGISGTFYDTYRRDLNGSNPVCISCQADAMVSRHCGSPSAEPNGRGVMLLCEDSTSTADSLTGGARPGQGYNNGLVWWNAQTQGVHQIWSPTAIDAGYGALQPHFNSDGTLLLWTERIPGCTPAGDNECFYGEWRLNVADISWVDNVPVIGTTRTYAQIRGGKWQENHQFIEKSDGSLWVMLTCTEAAANANHMNICQMQLKTAAGAWLSVNDAKATAISLTDTAAAEWDEHAYLSPDGAWIVYASSKDLMDPSAGGSVQLDWWVMRQDGTDKRRITYMNTPGNTGYEGIYRALADTDWFDDDTFYGLAQRSTSWGLGAIVKVDISLTQKSVTMGGSVTTSGSVTIQ